MTCAGKSNTGENICVQLVDLITHNTINALEAFAVPLTVLVYIQTKQQLWMSQQMPGQR